MADRNITVLIKGNSSQLQSELSKTSSMIGKSFSGIGSIIAGAVSIGSIVSMGKAALQMGDDLAKASEKLGIGAEKLSALSYAAELSDVSFEGLQRGMKFLAKATTDAQVSGSDAAIAFNAMGLATKDATGKVKPLDVLFSQVADKFSLMEDGAGKVSLALALLGRNGMDLIPVLNKSGAGIAQLEGEAKRFGATISDKTAKQLEEANDNLKSFWMTVKGTTASIMGGLLGAVKSLGDAFGESLGNAEGGFAFGPNAKTFKAPALPAKITAPNVDAIKKAMEERKKLDAEILKASAAKYAAEGKLAHEALAAEMGYDQEYFDTLTKMRMDDFAEWKKQQEEELALLEKFEDEKIGMLRGLQDVQRAEFEHTEPPMAAYTAEDAYKAAEAYGNVALALGQINGELGKQWEEVSNGQAIIRSYVNVWLTAHQSIKAIMFDLADTAVTRLSDSIAQLVVRGKADFRDMANSLIQEMTRMVIAAKVIAPLMQGIMGYFGGAPAAGTTSLSGSSASLGGNYSFTPKASGGPVMGGVGYLVGERGPELFVPGASGSIVPNGGGSGNVTVNIRNEGGQKVEAKSARASFDLQGTVIDIVLDGIIRNVHGLRSALGGA